MCVSVCQKVFQDEPKLFSRGKAQLVLITQNTVSITGSAIAFKATCSPTVSIRVTIDISLLLPDSAMQTCQGTPDDVY